MIASDFMFAAPLAWGLQPPLRASYTLRQTGSKAQALPQAAGSLGLTVWKHFYKSVTTTQDQDSPVI